jgi:hypothetical protein
VRDETKRKKTDDFVEKDESRHGESAEEMNDRKEEGTKFEFKSGNVGTI